MTRKPRPGFAKLATWADLPNELLDEILSYLSHTIHLKSASLVCSRLRGASQRLLNKSIVIDISGNCLPDTVKSSVKNYKKLSQMVNFDRSALGKKHNKQRELLLFLSLLLANPELFKSTRALRVEVEREISYVNWVREWEYKSGTVVLKDRCGRTGWKSPLSTNEDLMRGASLSGISQTLTELAPYSVALLVILHMLPKLRRLTISNPDTVLPTLTLASHGHLSGGIPSSLRNLETLKLGKMGISPWTWTNYSPLPLLFALPNLRAFRCRGWYTGHAPLGFDGSPWHSLLDQITAAAPSMHTRLSHLLFEEGRDVLDLKSLVQVLSVSENLSYLQLEHEPPLGPYNGEVDEFHEDDAGIHFQDPDVDYTSLAKALNPHSNSLRHLVIRWNCRPQADPNNLRAMRAIHPLGSLKAFTILRRLAIPAFVLFDTNSFLDVDPESVLASYLPSSLEYLNVFFYTKEELLGGVKQLGLQRHWPAMKAQSFPRLKTFQLEHGIEYISSETLVKLETLRKQLAGVGLTIWPPRYVFHISSSINRRF